MKLVFIRHLAQSLCLLALVCLISSCGTARVVGSLPENGIVVSVKDQKMAVLKEGKLIKTYPVSTSKFGLGDKEGSGWTPLGEMKVAKIIGDGYPSGAVFKSRKFTGEILTPNAPGRDPIVSRIFWLKGTESDNKNAFSRHIYIHGTPEERTIGTPASYGCIRMKSNDIIELTKKVKIGSKVQVVTHSLKSLKEPGS
jgi:lipoprotein-anchoring transpeptidase ErfK/SrfK